VEEQALDEKGPGLDVWKASEKINKKTGIV
jgi:hypothetical protein